MAAIVSDDEVYAQFKDDCKKQYSRMWSQFRSHVSDFDFESGPPGEEAFVSFFKHLRLEKNFASTSMWTVYSCLNSMMKRKYNKKLQDLPRITMLIKSFDTDVKVKANIFEDSDIKAFMLATMESSYWLVRQAICIVAFLGGLRLQECQDLLLEKMVRNNDGFRIVHSRVKQRSDKRETAFVVPSQGGFADRLALYLEKVNTELNKFTGRVWWTGTTGNSLKNQPMGRNMLGKVPHDVATRLKLANPANYTFHSFRRTSATAAADGSMTSEQMQSFFGWKHPSMCQEYISTSRPALLNMANALGNSSFELGEPHVEVEVALEDEADVQEAAQGEKENKVEMVASEDFDPLFAFEMEEDPEMYAAAGIPLPVSSTPDNSVNIQKTIESAISSVSALQGANVTVKVCVIANNQGTINF